MYRRIVVGTDGSSTADHAVDAAGQLARLSGAEVQVVTAYRPVRAVVMAGAIAVGGSERSSGFGTDEQVAAEQVVRRARTRLESNGVQVHSVALRGEPADALLAVAEELNADLVVLGCRRFSGVRRSQMPNTADRVAQNATCSVYLVHPH